jgi:homoserine kinase
MTVGNRAKAYAPASVANVAVGFDLLGFSAGVLGDTATVEVIEEPKVVVAPIEGLKIKLPTDPLKNTASAGLVQLIQDRKFSHGFKVTIEKGIPLGSGLGGSAASAVAAIFAANFLIGGKLSKEEMLTYALIGESVASGSKHADNIAPSLYGGFTLATVDTKDIAMGDETGEPDSVNVVEIPVPQELWCVALHPHIEVETKSARNILKTDVSLKTHIAQSANLALVLCGLFESDFFMIKRGLRDLIIEPQRAHLIPGFHDIQKAAISANALGCTISGAGPSIFALAEGQHAALEIQKQMNATARSYGASTSWAFQMKKDGARLLTV